MKIWKIGVVGCGNIAETVYIPQMEKIKNARIVAVCDLSLIHILRFPGR